MAVAFVKNVGSGTGTGTTTVVTVPAAGVAIGNMLVVRGYQASSSAVVSSVVDTQGNTYSEWVAKSGTGDWIAAWKCAVTTALVSGNTITITWSVKGDSSLVVEEFSGVANTEDGETIATGTSTTPSATLTTTNAANLLVGHVGINNGSPDGFTEDADSDGGSTWVTLTSATSGSDNISRGAYKITTSAVANTYNPTLGTSRTWFEQLGSLKETAAAFTGIPSLVTARRN